MPSSLGDNSRRKGQCNGTDLHLTVGMKQHFHSQIVCKITDYGSDKGAGKDLQKFHDSFPPVFQIFRLSFSCGEAFTCRLFHNLHYNRQHSPLSIVRHSVESSDTAKRAAVPSLLAGDGRSFSLFQPGTREFTRSGPIRFCQTSISNYCCMLA